MPNCGIHHTSRKWRSGSHPQASRLSTPAPVHRLMERPRQNGVGRLGRSPSSIVTHYSTKHQTPPPKLSHAGHRRVISRASDGTSHTTRSFHHLPNRVLSLGQTDLRTFRRTTSQPFLERQEGQTYIIFCWHISLSRDF